MKTKCELFWNNSDGAFSDEHKVVHWLALDGSSQPLRFPLPALAAPVTRLRFDFADTPATVLVSAITVRDAAGAVQWQWDGDSALFQDLHEASLSATEGGLLLRGESLDPYCLLAVPAEQLARLEEGWAVEMDLVPQVDSLHDLTTRALQNDSRMTAVTKLYLTQKKQVDLLIQEVIDQKHKIEHLSAANEALRKDVDQLTAASRMHQGAISRFEENDAIIRQKLTSHDGVLKSITGSKWLRRLFPISDLPS